MQRMSVNADTISNDRFVFQQLFQLQLPVFTRFRPSDLLVVFGFNTGLLDTPHKNDRGG